MIVSDCPQSQQIAQLKIIHSLEASKSNEYTKNSQKLANISEGGAKKLHYFETC